MDNVQYNFDVIILPCSLLCGMLLRSVDWSEHMGSPEQPKYWSCKDSGTMACQEIWSSLQSPIMREFLQCVTLS